jgi:hypothetical protein
MNTVGNIKNMHYDFKQRLNKIDSNAYVGLKIPEIDRVLNRAINFYILLVAVPRFRNQFGFEISQRSIDDIKELVINDSELVITNNVAVLPSDYLYYLSTETLTGTKDTCVNKKLNAILIKHDDKNNDAEFYDSNFDWGECNIRFFNGGIKLFNSDFTITKFSINYLKVHPYVHNAGNFGSGSYTLPNGTVLGSPPFVDCLLPDITHSEIVDLAVLLTTGDLDLQNSYQLKQIGLQTKQILT